MNTLRFYVRGVFAVAGQRVLTSTRYPVDFWTSLVGPFFSVAVSMYLARAFIPPGDAASRSLAGVPDYRAFILTSMVLWSYIETQLYFGFSLEGEMRRGTLESVFLSPLPSWCYLTGLSVYGMLRASLEALAALALGFLFFGAGVTPNWPMVAVAFILNLFVVYGYGLILAAAILVFRSGMFTYVWDCLLPLLVGEAYSIAVLPKPLQSVARLIPLTYGLDLIRWAVSGAPTFAPVPLEFIVTGGSAVLVPGVGLWVFSILERAAKRRGTLGQF
ncbi:MAG TPA: ABC transporter permease [Firmicutes bacterium]|nr:ABC transporter permease [Candidatus Fermentithermobacillaceae bacterium]